MASSSVIFDQLSKVVLKRMLQKSSFLSYFLWNKPLGKMALFREKKLLHVSTFTMNAKNLTTGIKES